VATITLSDEEQLKLNEHLLCECYVSSAGDRVKELIQRGANVNFVGERNVFGGAFPLYVASGCGHAANVSILLAAGANVNQATRNGWTPLCIASRRGHESIVRMLLVEGANVNQVTGEGWSSLYLANLCGYEAVVQLLLAAGAVPIEYQSSSSSSFCCYV